MSAQRVPGSLESCVILNPVLAFHLQIGHIIAFTDLSFSRLACQMTLQSLQEIFYVNFYLCIDINFFLTNF